MDKRLAPFALRFRSVSVRLAIWYTLATAATLSCLFAAGYQLLERHLIHGLDLLTTAQFEQVKSHLHLEDDKLDPAALEERLRKVTDHAAVLFYIDVHSPGRGTIFQSTNIRGRVIPDVKGERFFNSHVEGIGDVRVGEFILGPIDVNVATPLRTVHNVMEGYAEVCLALFGTMLVASGVIGYCLSQLALRPIRKISETANRIRSDNLSERIEVSEVRDEVSDLAHMLNQMFDRLEFSFNNIRHFAAEVSHELKTPLSLLRLLGEKMLLDGTASAAHQESIQVQLEELARLDQIVEELLFLSRVEARGVHFQMVEANPARFLHAFAQDAKVLAEHHQVRFAYTHDGEGPVQFDDKRMRQVLLNLLSNALHISPAGSHVTLRSMLADGKWVLRVEDEGPGLPADKHEQMFERFVRHQPQESGYKGSGLGLAICRSIVGLHKGRIFATHGPNDRGLHVVIEIPALAA
ncbi:HAMP domain-containing protein [Massilia cavernae]|uniref:histidine kinase n=2 Tax=Massilia cavernae TaxID=2320864 RepID=A0A418Y4K7_9BURK|nr:HAMP domain-containing protein [Massilia cavernae]